MKITFKKELKADSDEQIFECFLKTRKITDSDAFLNPSHPETLKLENFGHFNRRVHTLITLLKEAKKSKRPVIIYTDYDADGITGGAIMWETLHTLGFHALPYVPHRAREGYGFSIAGIDVILKSHPKPLIISVDHGITAENEIKYAKEKGASVVVTDHHLAPTDGPPKSADAVFHIPALSGSGVSYMVAKTIYEQFAPSVSVQHSERLNRRFRTDYTALAAVGTVADLVPLTDASRSIVYHGLKAFKATRRPGIKAILTQAGITHRAIGTYEIGYMIAPRINAVGRLGHALDALRLLCTTNTARAHELASHIGESNSKRQDLVRDAVAEVEKIIDASATDSQKLLILISNSWHEGIIGLIASRMVEKYYRPVIVITKSDNFYKGSARSISGFHMTKFLRSLSSYLINVGGHAQAAGFSIEEKKLSAFQKAAQKTAAPLLTKEILTRVIEVDLKVPFAKVSLSLAKQFQKLEPFGIGNPAPKLVSTGYIRDLQRIGKEKNHLKLKISESSAGNAATDCISFNSGETAKILTIGIPVEFVYTPDVNRWNGKESLQAKIHAISPLSTPAHP